MPRNPGVAEPSANAELPPRAWIRREASVSTQLVEVTKASAGLVSDRLFSRQAGSALSSGRCLARRESGSPPTVQSVAFSPKQQSEIRLRECRSSGKPAVYAYRHRRLLPVGSSGVRNVDDGRHRIFKTGPPAACWQPVSAD